MSLDVYLKSKDKELERCVCECCGDEHFTPTEKILFRANITHNLGQMASAAGIYLFLWRPQEEGFEIANQLIEPLEKGYALLISDPEKFKAFDSPNGYGVYEHFCTFVLEYLQACKEYPDAIVEVSR